MVQRAGRLVRRSVGTADDCGAGAGGCRAPTGRGAPSEDYAGDLLYSTLAKFGFSNDKFQARPDDGLKLKDTLISNAVRCVPPENKPTGAEIVTCRQFLIARIAQMPNLKVMVALGQLPMTARFARWAPNPRFTYSATPSDMS